MDTSDPSRAGPAEPGRAGPTGLQPQRQTAVICTQSTVATSSTANIEIALDMDEFEDATDQEMNIIPLTDALKECNVALNMFFNNEITEASTVMKRWAHGSLYHAHGAAIFEFISAVLTMDPDKIRSAQEALEHTFVLFKKKKKGSSTLVQSIGSMMKNVNYALLTDDEAHGELVCAELLLLMACIVAIQGETSGYLKALVRITSSYRHYRNCVKALQKTDWENSTNREDFESGVLLGMACFNVLLAVMPPKIVSMLHFIGFKADLNKGLEELKRGSAAPGLRSVLCDLTLLSYYLVIGQYAAILPDHEIAESLINKNLQKYPNSAWFLMFEARLQMLRGLVRESVQTYAHAASHADHWTQMKHITYWESMWAHAMMTEWTKSATFAALLERESPWSRTIYAYTNAAILMQLEGDASKEDLARIKDLTSRAPGYMRRVLGKSVPMEKFAAKRCKRWAKRGYLVLPALELLALWNMFSTVAANRNLANRMLTLIKDTEEKICSALNNNNASGFQSAAPNYDADDFALVRFLHGSLLSRMEFPRLAMKALDDVLGLRSKLLGNTFLVPYSTVELAMCHYALGDRGTAITLLYDARKNYSSYALESRLQIRIQANLANIQAGHIPINDPYLHQDGFRPSYMTLAQAAELVPGSSLEEAHEDEGLDRAGPSRVPYETRRRLAASSGSHAPSTAA